MPPVGAKGDMEVIPMAREAPGDLEGDPLPETGPSGPPVLKANHAVDPTPETLGESNRFPERHDRAS